MLLRMPHSVMLLRRAAASRNLNIIYSHTMLVCVFAFLVWLISDELICVLEYTIKS